MKGLLIHPLSPDPFWNLKHLMPFLGTKAAYPPLGLLTVAAMLPREVLVSNPRAWMETFALTMYGFHMRKWVNQHLTGTGPATSADGPADRPLLQDGFPR